MTLGQFPHCDQRILHGPVDGCEFCDAHPEWQELRRAWGIAFTGHAPRATLPICGTVSEWDDGEKWKCRQVAGHDKGGYPTPHSPLPEFEATPCPADTARPPGEPADHRRWGGNKPSSATGDPSWPAETAASVMMYGDKGGRQPE
jgi:hypothetical protein